MKFNRFWLSKPVIKLTAGNNGLIPGSSFCDNCPSFPFFPLFPLYPGGPGSPGGPGGPGTTLSLPGGPGGPGCPSAGPGGPYDGNVKYRFYMYLLGWGNPQKNLLTAQQLINHRRKQRVLTITPPVCLTKDSPEVPDLLGFLAALGVRLAPSLISPALPTS